MALVAAARLCRYTLLIRDRPLRRGGHRYAARGQIRQEEMICIAGLDLHQTTFVGLGGAGVAACRGAVHRFLWPGWRHRNAGGRDARRRQTLHVGLDIRGTGLTAKGSRGSAGKGPIPAAHDRITRSLLRRAGHKMIGIQRPRAIDDAEDKHQQQRHRYAEFDERISTLSSSKSLPPFMLGASVPRALMPGSRLTHLRIASWCCQ